MTPLRRKLWRELAQLRGQAIAIAAVVCAGIATMAMMLSNHAALERTRAAYYADHRFADVFATVKRAPDGLRAELAALPGVREAETRVQGFALLDLPGVDEAISAQLVSLPPEGGMNRLFLRAGRLPTPESEREIVLGEAFAQARGLGPGDPLTVVLNGRREVLQVVGVGLSPEFVYQIRPGDLFPDFARFAVIWMPRAPLARAMDMDGAFNSLLLRLAPDAIAADVLDALDARLVRYGGTGAHARDLQMSHRFLDEELGQLAVMARLFSAVFLAVAAYLINVVIGRVIAAQREQIAVLRAFGYTRREIGAHYGALALLLALAGLPPGLLLGGWLGQRLAGIYMDFYRFPYLDWSMPGDVPLLALGFCLAAAAAGAATGLLRAFRLTPAQAMQPESPPRFRRSLAERAGLARLLDPAARMVLRNLERRPLRTAMGVLGIGLACGIVMLAGFQRGAVERMIAVQFGLAQHDDLSVLLAEPAARRAAQELAALPGVGAVEPFRSTAVRLVAGHRRERTALLGFDQPSELKRLLGDDLVPARLPADGLLMTDWLAEQLALRPGDAVRVEFLDGRREPAVLTLDSVVSEPLGTGAYLRRDALNALLREDDVISGAWLSLRDPAARPALLADLRARPRIAAVSDRGAMLAGFRATMAQGILVFTTVATLMAASIALGVVYNSARITLAERGRELASLRVLGYTRAEVRRLLDGELLALALLALLPGLALGIGMTALLVQAFRSELYRIPLQVQPEAFGLAGLVVLASTALSLRLVRRRLDALDLVAVLKSAE